MGGQADKMSWREHGVRIVRGTDLDSNTPQTPGMTRAAAINFARAGARKLYRNAIQWLALSASDLR